MDFNQTENQTVNTKKYGIIILGIIFFVIILLIFVLNFLTKNSEQKKSESSNTIVPTSINNTSQTFNTQKISEPTPLKLKSLENWKTFKSSEDQYLVQYPSISTSSNIDTEGFECKKGQNNQKYSLFALEKKVSLTQDPCTLTDSTFRIEIKSGSEEDIRAIQLQQPQGSILKSENINVDGVIGVKNTFKMKTPFPEQAEWVEILLFKNGKGYQIILWDTYYEELFNEMIKTLKFSAK